jgi:hypothetical protein
MKTLNKRRLFYCLVISIVINGAFFLRQLLAHRNFERQGIIRELYIKSLNKTEATFFQKAKYTSVAAIYFLTSNGDTIHDVTKNTWAMRAKALEEIPYYLPLDSVIYDRQSPKNYQMISEFRNYSKTYSAVSYFLVGLSIFTVWFYLMTVLFEKGLARFRSK